MIFPISNIFLVTHNVLNNIEFTLTYLIMVSFGIFVFMIALKGAEKIAIIYYIYLDHRHMSCQCTMLMTQIFYDFIFSSSCSRSGLAVIKHLSTVRVLINQPIKTLYSVYALFWLDEFKVWLSNSYLKVWWLQVQITDTDIFFVTKWETIA